MDDNRKTLQNGGLAKKAAVALALGLLAAAFFYWDLGQYLTLEYLKGSRERFETLYAGHRLAVIGGYLAVYILVTALSLPGAAVMTLAGGALFGLAVGTAVVSVASTVGATLACLAARTLLRDWVQARFGEKLRIVNDGIDREGGLYLFTLRLIPVFPFFVINLVMGLTSMRLTTFFWVSQLGMLPATIVFVNAGKELARVDSLASILSPSLLASFAVLGLFPLAVKKTMQYLRPRLAGRFAGRK